MHPQPEQESIFRSFCWVVKKCTPADKILATPMLHPAVQLHYKHPTAAICFRIHTPGRTQHYSFLHPSCTPSHTWYITHGITARNIKPSSSAHNIATKRNRPGNTFHTLRENFTLVVSEQQPQTYTYISRYRTSHRRRVKLCSH